AAAAAPDPSAAARPADELQRTRYAQPAAFVTGYALARLWEAHGVRPDALIGYSLGEYVAACLAGVFTLPDALGLVARRARLIDALPPGAMLAVPMAEADVARYLTPDVRVAAVNGPTLCVLGGPADEVAEVATRLAEAGVAHRRLPTAQAFHTPMMAPVLDAFVELVAEVPRRPPEIPYVSNVTGTWVTGDQATDPAFWGAHLLRPVRFADGLAALDPSGGRVLVELGPGQSLGSLATQVSPGAEPAVPSLPGAFDDATEERHFASAVGRVWLLGADPDDPAPEGRRPRRVSLPTYPFQRRRHWAAVTGATRTSASAPEAARKTDVADFFQVPSWRTLPPRPARTPSAGEHWLLLADDTGVGAALADALADSAASVTTVTREDAPDFAELLAALRRDGRRPDRIVHLWMLGLTPDADEADATARGFGSLLALGRALAAEPVGDPGGEPNGDPGGRPGGEPFSEPGGGSIDITVVTDELHVVAGTETGTPLTATVLGVCRVLPLEHPHLTCRNVDVSLSSATPGRTADELLRELSDRAGPAVVALRGRRRFTTGHQPVRLDPPGDVPRGRNYLITGGLGGVGLAVARELARTEGAGLALVSRTGPPSDERDPRARAVRELERLGARVVVLAADVTDSGRLREAGERAVAELGPVHAVVHAAGVAGGGLVQLRDPADADRVLAPKVRGGLAVTAMAEHIGAASVVLCSSTLALTGAVGQADYAAANAFLDALAQHAAVRDGGPEIVSVNWDAWQDAGMAHRHLAGGEPGGGEPEPGPATHVDHPLLRARTEHDDARTVYDASVGSTSSWLVDEHRMLGDPVVPGTGHLELARAAFADLTGAERVELTDFRFATPVVLGPDGERELRVVLDRTGTASARVTVVGPLPGDAASRWQVHAVGEIAALDTAPPPDRPIAELTGRMRDLGLPGHTDLMSFGGRSRCLRRVWEGDREALAELVLPDPFLDDLHRLHLHPSLLDLAAGFVGTRLAETFRIPISYGRLRLHRPLTRRVFSHHRYAADDRPENETRTADITLHDEDGRVLVEIGDFVLKRVADLRKTLDSARGGAGADGAFLEYRPSAREEQRPTASGEKRTIATPGPLAAHLATGLRPAEGADALRRLLAARIGPQVAVATRDLDAIAADIAASALTPDGTPRGAGEDDAADAAGRPAPHPRPPLRTPYRPPADPLQEKLAALWQDLLGIDRIGVDDVFFELGGHSLLGLEMVNRIGRDLGLAVPLGALFEARTVARLADLLHREAAPAAEHETREG
ncbi:SDR family NAD(P)-dependent oxidoreductase, partial [Actinomadura logoneensis]